MTLYRLFLLLLLSPLSCLAQSPFYMGANAGYTDIRQGDFDDDWGYRIYGAYRFHSAWSIEAGYADFGTFDIDERGIKAGVDVTNVYDISLVLGGRLLPEFDTRIELKLGAYHADIETDLITRGDSNGETGYTLGTSLVHPIGEKLDAEFTWRYYDEIKDIDVTTYMLGMRYRF